MRTMKPVNLYLAAVLLVTVPWRATAQGQALTLREETSGSNVVVAAIAKIWQTEIFSTDNGILRRIAYVETRDGGDEDAYRAGYHGGIWAVDQALFLRTQDVASYPRLVHVFQQINSALGIDWSNVQWDDLRKPLYSALAARIFLLAVPEAIPVAIQSQAEYWQENYNSGGIVEDFVAAVNELEASESIAPRPAPGDVGRLQSSSPVRDLRSIKRHQGERDRRATEECSVRGIDLYFVLDSTESVGHSNFELMKDFVSDVINGFDIGSSATQVGVVSFDSTARFHFYLNSHNSKTSLLNAVGTVFYTGGSARNLGTALDLLLLQGYTTANGGRASNQAIPRVAVVLTNGESNDFTTTAIAAATLRGASVQIFAVGVGSNVNGAELDAIASDSTYVSLLTGFDTSQFDALQSSICPQICTAPAPLQIGVPVSDTIGSGETKYFEYAFPTVGLTLKLDVDQGSVTLFASDLTRTPNENQYVWMTEANGESDVLIDPAELGRSAGDTVYVSMEGLGTTNTFTLDSLNGTPSTREMNVESSANEFFVGFVKNLDQPPDLRLFVTTPDTTVVNFDVYSPFTGTIFTGTATHTSTTTITLSSTYQVFSSSETNKGIRIRAEAGKSLVVYGLNYRQFTSDAFLAIPCETLAVDEYEYYALTYDSNSFETYILLVGCEDSTTITAPIVGTITVNQLETHLIESSSDLSGSRVVSNKPISVIVGHVCSNIIVGACDHLTEAVPPTASWGNFFLVGSLLGKTTGEVYRVLAAHDTTAITVRCDTLATQSYSLNAGGWTEFQIVSNSYCAIESNNPMLCMQFGLGDNGGFGDPFQTMLPAVEQYSNNYVLTVLSEFVSNYMNVAVAPEYFDPSQIYLDSSPLSGTWTAVTCSDGTTCGYMLRTAVAPGEYRLYHQDATARIGVSVYGFNNYNSYGYIGGLQLIPENVQAPEPPSQVVTGGVDSSSAMVSWDAPVITDTNPLSAIAYYEVLLIDIDFGSPSFSDQTTETFYTFTDLSGSTSYVCRVAAINGRGAGDYSISISFTTVEAPPSAPPRVLSGFNLTSTSITLTWLSPPPLEINGEVQYYIVQITEVYTGRFFSVFAFDTHVSIGPLHPYYVYECRVAAYTTDQGPFTTPVQLRAAEAAPSSPPQNVSIISVNTNSISLSWNPPPFEGQNGLIRRYRISVTEVETGVTTEVTSGITEVTVGGLLAFYNYTCIVAAETIEVGAFSLEIRVQLPEDVPTGPPQNVNGSTIDSTSILIRWEAPAPEQLNGFVRGYVVNVTEEDTGQTFLLTSSTTSIVISSLHPSYTYLCQIAVTTVGTGPFSTAVAVTTDETAPSSSPQDFVATSTSPRSVYISWNPPPPEDQNGEIIRYIINVTVQETGETFQLFSVTNSLSVGDLRPYTTFICVIAAVTRIGVGPFSTTVVVMTPEDVPSIPRNPTVLAVEGSPMELLATWEPPAEANGIITFFTVYCYDNISDVTIFAVAPGDQSGTTVTGLTGFTYYTCVVTANTSAGESNESLSVSVRTVESVPSDPPGNFEAAVMSSTAVFLSWSPPLIPNGRIIFYQTTYNLSGVQVVANSSVEDGETYFVTGLEEYTLYEFGVTASTRIGIGPFVTVVVRTDPGRPDVAPVDVQSTDISRRSATITWILPPGIDRKGPIVYYVLVIRDEGFNTSDVIINTTLTSYTVTDLEEYNLYTCTVAAATTAGVGPYSSPFEFTTLQDIPSAAPLTLTGVAQSSTVIILMWEPPPPIDVNGILRYYAVEITERETGSLFDVIAIDQDLHFGSLHPYYNYDCRVAAHTIGTGPYTNTITVQTEEAPPHSSPSTPSASSVTAESFTLTWAPPPVEETNGVIRNYVITVTEIDTGRVFTENSNTTQVTLAGLHPFYTYECRVAAETVGTGPYSTQIVLQLSEDAPSGPPVNPSGSAVDSTTIALTWSPPLDEEQNGILRQYIISVTELETGDIFTFTAFGTEFMLQALHPFYVYEITITAVTIGPGPMSAVFSVQTLEVAPSAPPESPTAGEISSDTISLTWTPPPLENQNGIIIRYVINVTVVGTGETFLIFSSTNSLTLGSLRPYTTYVCVIAAETSAGVGPFSISISAQTDEASPSSPPEDVVATAPSSSSISLTWSPPPMVSWNGVIRVYRINITEVETGRVFFRNSTTTSITVTALHPYYLYQCTITAYTVATGPYTEIVTVRTPESAPSGYPQSFQAEATSSRSALITWDPPLPSEQNGVVTGYIINVTVVETGETFQLLSQTNSLTIDTLSPFTTYLCVIAATTSVGTGPFSTVFTLRTPEDVPTVSPQNPVGAALDSRTLSLRWDPPPAEQQNGIVREYRIRITEVETGRTFQRNSSTVTIVVSFLHPYYTYSWIVTAYTIGEGPFTDMSTVRTAEDVPSGAPQNFSAQAIGSRNIWLAWSPPLAEDRNGIITGYVISVIEIVTGDTQQFFTVSLYFNVSSLNPFTEYQCIVAANTSIGQGPFSASIPVMTNPEVPGTHPSNATGTALNSTHIYLTWDPPEDPNGDIHEYRINVTELATGDVFYYVSEITEITIGPLHPFYAYNCTIVAVNIIGQGPYSGDVVVETLEDAPSGPPLNLLVEVEDSQTLFLSWEPPSPEQQNGIIRQYTVTITASNTGAVVTTETAVATTLRVSGLDPFTNYTCSVAAYTVSTGPAVQSPPVETLHSAPTESPQGFMATVLSSTSLLLTWQPPAPEHRNGIITQYVVSIMEIETGSLTQLTTEELTVTVSSLHPYYTYSCRVAAETVAVGPSTALVTVELPEDAPASSPTDVSTSMVGTTSFLLSWREPPPEDQNGIIRHYLIDIIEENTGAEFQLNTTTADTEILIESLHPSYRYICTVAAITVEPGPYSSPITVDTETAPPSSSPTDTEAMAESSTSVTVSWEPPPLENQNGVIIGYIIRITSTNSGESRELQSTSTTITISSLQPFTTYIIVVTAETSAGTGPYSSELMVTTQEDAPTAPPESVTDLVVTSTSVTLMWSSPPSNQINGIIRQYLVFVIEEDTGRNFSLTSVQTELVVGDLHPFYTYRFAVSAFTVDAGPYTQQYSVQTEQDVPSDSPQNFETIPEDSRTLLLTWEPPPPEEQNGIILEYRINVTVSETGNRFQLTSDVASLRVPDLHPYYTYLCIITAVTVVGPGPFSQVFTVQMPQDVPSAAPQNTAGETVSSTIIRITWEAPEFGEQNGIISSYNISLLEVATSATFMYQLEGLRTELVITSLHPYYEYRCSVAAATEVGIGPFSTPFVIRTAADVSTVPPQNVYTRTVNVTTIYLGWEPPPADRQNGVILEYLIVVDVEETREQFQLSSASPPLVVTDLHPYYTYSFSIAAVTVVGSGPFSEPASNRTFADAPSVPPQNVAGVAVSSSSIRLTWVAPPADQQNGVITSYHITITEIETGTIREYDTHGEDVLMIVNDLHPFYYYHCEIAAFTVGLGPVAYVEVQTLQEVPSDVPQNITVSAVNATTAWLTWDPPPEEHRNGIITRYSIRVFGVDPAGITELTTDQTAIAVGGLRPFFTHTFAIAAHTIGIGPFSTTVPLQTPEGVPSAPPQTVAVRVESSTSVTISWLPPFANQWNGIITNYTVVYKLLGPVGELSESASYPSQSISIPQPDSPLANNPDPTHVTVPLQTEMVLLEDLQEYYVYQFTVYLQNAVGRSEETDPIMQEMPGAALSGPPTNVAVEVLSSTSLRIMWGPPDPFEQNGAITGYEIVLLLQNGSRVNYAASNSTFSLQIEGLAKYKQYSISVAARSTYGVGPYSEPVVRRTSEDVPTGPPMDVEVEPLSSSSLRVTWDPPDSSEQNGIIIGYEIVIQSPTGSRRMNDTSGNTFSLQIEGLEMNEAYSISVAARTALGVGPYSQPAVGRTLQIEPPPPEVVAFEELNSTAVSLSWRAPDDPSGAIVGYQIYYYGYRNQPSVTRAETPEIVDGPYVRNVTETSAVISDLMPELTYDFQIRARTSTGYGVNSTTIERRPVIVTTGRSESDSAARTAVIVVPIVVVVVLLIVLIAVIIILYRRRSAKRIYFTSPRLGRSTENEYGMGNVAFTNKSAELISSTEKERLDFQESDKDKETSTL